MQREGHDYDATPGPMRRRRLLAYGALGAASAALLRLPASTPGAGTRSAAAQPLSLAQVSEAPAQTMQGFGAAGAWWPNDLVHFDAAVQEQVAALLFSERGIALSAYRYNIGGGGVGVEHRVRAPETFLVAPGHYDWSRDPGGQRFLRLAAEHGVPMLIGFVNSAPPVWTTTGTSCGGMLRPGTEAAFARYLADIVTHFRDVEGITFSYVSPMNEPSYRFEGCGQEGMAVPVAQRATLVQALGRELALRAPYSRVIADESSQIRRHFLAEVPQWLGVPGTVDSLAALAHHLYDFPDAATLRQARQVGEQYGVPLWSTEVCCYDTRTGTWGQQYDPTISGAVLMANLIWQGMTEANDAAFHWWVALSSELGCDPARDPDCANQANDEGWNDGLLYYDPNYAENGNQQIYLTKRYYALGNFSRYVRPGAQRHDVTGGPANLRILACANAAAPGAPAMPVPGPADVSASPPAQRPRGPIATPPAQRPTGAVSGVTPEASWSIVVINTAPAGSAATAVALQLPGAERARLVATDAVETSASRNLEPVALPEVSATGQLAAAVPAQSITTYVLRSTRAP